MEAGMLNAPVRWMPGNGPVYSDVYSGDACANNVNESSLAPAWGSARWFGKSSRSRSALREAFAPGLSVLVINSMRSSGLTLASAGAKIQVAEFSTAVKRRRCMPEIEILISACSVFKVQILPFLILNFPHLRDKQILQERRIQDFSNIMIYLRFFASKSPVFGRSPSKRKNSEKSCHFA